MNIWIEYSELRKGLESYQFSAKLNRCKYYLWIEFPFLFFRQRFVEIPNLFNMNIGTNTAS